MNNQLIFRNRRTYQSFKRQAVLEEHIIQAIEAANYAPCHHRTFPWKFYSIKYQTKIYLADLLVELKKKREKISKENESKLKEKFFNPAELILATQLISIDSLKNKENYAACSCAIQNLMLSFSANGIGTKWSTGEIIRSDLTYKLLSLNRLEEEIIGLIYIGYGDPPHKIDRPNLKQIFFSI